ncbi:methylase [Micractinium conductrix]|uniref:DNA (cytosine-5-)-methyltransferase n=1 Tax=Micractinium conductrix TaxID=554055 RepID=A0A2P6VMM9_9CHLO|nr:methylase [Micractinium conductrix]|eukprot:PSC75340.1 methylase [Micractinium conductrix]
MKVTSLFSGAGGLDLGLHQAGHELLLMCDSDAGARQVLRTAFPGVRIHDDVISLEKLPEETELLVAGFPCVDVSRAGLRRGLEGQSTGLVRHVFRLLQRAKDDRRPVPWVLLENVEALLDRHGGDPPVMQYCTQQLIQLGYQSWAYRVVNSAGFGVPNRRRRVFLVASLHGDARDVLLSQGSQRCTGGCEQLFGGRLCYPCHANRLRNLQHHSRVSYALDMGNAMSPAGEDVVPTFTTSNERMLLLLAEGASGMLRVEDAERLQGFEEGHTRACWPIQTPGVGAHRTARRDTDGEAAASKRWDLLGNAVTVPVARWLGERLANPYQYKYHGVSTQDRPLETLLVEGAAPEAAAAMRPRPAHPWSYVTTDQLQESHIFEYLTISQRKKLAVRRRRHRERVAAAAAAAAAAAEAGEGEEDAATALAAAEAELYAAVGGEEVASSDEGSGSEWEADEEEALVLEGFDREMVEVVAVARAARKAAAEERAAAAAAAQPAQQQQQQQQQQPSGPSTPCDVSLQGPPSSPESGEGSSGEGGSGSGSAAGATPSGEAPPAAAAAGAAQEARAERRLARTDAEAEQKELFQAAVLRKKQRGQMQQGARQQANWDREAWPRAAWWVRGLGCFGCEEMSECPVPAPFVPLGDFVHAVGREGTQEEIHTYLHRMREKGWDVGHTIEKLLKNNTRISAEAHEVVRIPGLLTDADMIGDMVWALDKTTGCWWPGEKLDPLAMPAGRDLPPGCLRALSADEKLASLPQYQKLAAKLTQEQRTESRRVLVSFMPVQGSGQWRWYKPTELEEFEGNADRERGVTDLIKSNGGRWKHGEEMGRAIKDAKASLWVKHNRNSLEADRMRRTRASAAAGMINLKQRCGQCKTCMNNFAGQRRFDCLTQRMKAAALSGHAGAQVGVNGEGAIGARVQVWWEGDQTFYSGILALYDAVSTEHTVCYDDGEVGMHRLWQHDERIRLSSPVEQWPRDAALARARLAAAQERLRNREQGRRAAAAAPPPPPVAPPEGPKAAYVMSTAELRKKNREAFEVLFGSAVKGLEATGEVPELTAEEREVVTTAQAAARAAAGRTARHAGKGAPGKAGGAAAGKPGSAGAVAPAGKRASGRGGRGKGKGKAKVEVEEEEEEVEEALVSPADFFEAAEAAVTGSSPEGGSGSSRGRGKRARQPAKGAAAEAEEEEEELDASEDVPLGEQLAAAAGKRLRLENPGSSKSSNWHRHPATGEEWVCSMCYHQEYRVMKKAQRQAQRDAAAAAAADEQEARPPPAAKRQRQQRPSARRQAAAAPADKTQTRSTGAAPAATAAVMPFTPQTLVGQQVSVFLPDARPGLAFLLGKVIGYDAETGEHTAKFEDGGLVDMKCSEEVVHGNFGVWPPPPPQQQQQHVQAQQQHQQQQHSAGTPQVSASLAPTEVVAEAGAEPEGEQAPVASAAHEALQQQQAQQQAQQVEQVVEQHGPQALAAAAASLPGCLPAGASIWQALNRLRPLLVTHLGLAAVQVSAFNRAFIAADSEAQQGVYTDLRACLLAGDAAGARSWVHTFCGELVGRNVSVFFPDKRRKQGGSFWPGKGRAGQGIGYDAETGEHTAKFEDGGFVEMDCSEEVVHWNCGQVADPWSPAAVVTGPGARRPEAAAAAASAAAPDAPAGEWHPQQPMPVQQAQQAQPMPAQQVQQAQPVLAQPQQQAHQQQQVSAFNRAFFAADSEAQQGVYTDLRACLLAGDAAGARSWVHTFCGVAGGGGSSSGA